MTGERKLQQLRLYIKPSWTVHGFEEFMDLPEGWDLWTEGEQTSYVDEVLNQQIEDRGYDVIEEDE